MSRPPCPASCRREQLVAVFRDGLCALFESGVFQRMSGFLAQDCGVACFGTVDIRTRPRISANFAARSDVRLLTSHCIIFLRPGQASYSTVIRNLLGIPSPRCWSKSVCANTKVRCVNGSTVTKPSSGTVDSHECRSVTPCVTVDGRTLESPFLKARFCRHVSRGISSGELELTSFMGDA
jgi:hypothetical protein